MNNICLIGFMGSGKSSIAKEISRKYSKEHIELDELIELRAAKSVGEIFETFGEEYFRKLETETLKSLKCENAVISCGGGIVLKEQNVQLLNKLGIVIWLKAEPATIYDRIKNASNRPLLKGNMTEDYIRNLLNLRIVKYEQAAFDCLVTDCMSIEQVADYIYEKYMQ